MRIKQEKIAIIAFIIILFIVVCAPYLWRVALGNTSIAGQQYYIAKGMANEVSKNGMTTFSEYPFSLYILIIGYFDQKQSMLFFMALGIAASALLYLFVRTHKFRPTHSIFIATAWVISYSFASLVYTDGITLFVCVLLLIALLLIRHKKLILAGIFLLLIAATSPVLLFASVMIVLMYASWHMKSARKIVMMCIAPVAVALMSWLIGGQFTRTIMLTIPQTQFFQELGSIGGIPLVVFCLGLGGGLSFWNKKYKYAYILFTIMLVATIFIPSWLPFVAVILTIISAASFLFLANKVWHSQLVYRAFIISFLAGLAMASIFGLQSISNEPPTYVEQDSLFELAKLAPGITLSHANYGSLISVLGKHESFIDELDGPIVGESADDIFRSIRLTNVTDLLSENEIRYIYITQEMRSGLVWNHTDQELLFLLRNNVTFSKVYSDDFAEIYSVNVSYEQLS